MYNCSKKKHAKKKKHDRKKRRQERSRIKLAKRRTEELLQAMTLEEKVSFVTGNLNNFYGFYNEPIERLGIPALTMADGPAGVRIADPDIQNQQSTALPAPLALAATWDTNAAKAYGDLIGNEAFNTTHNASLAPGLDIARLPWGARNFESMGEDPFLQGKLGVQLIKGIQSHPVFATAKHFLLNNQETDRHTINSVASERAIFEIYSRPFADIIKHADVGSIMSSFNQVNGEFATQNRTLLTDILKNELNFKGFVMSDYGSNHSTVQSALAGLDHEQPGDPDGFWGDQLLAAVEDGDVPEAVIDDKVRRMLFQMFRKGLFDHPVENNPIPAVEHGQVAREIAEQGMVLLKNENAALPLNGNQLNSIAVIGPDADNASAAGGGSSLVNPTYTVSPLEGISTRAGDGVEVMYAPGTDPIGTGAIFSGPSAVPSSILMPENQEGTGLTAAYWSNNDFEGDPSLVRTDQQVNIALGFYNFEGFNASSPKIPEIPGEFNSQLSAVWTGFITAPMTGEYELSLTSLGSSHLYLNGELVIENAGVEFETTTFNINLVEGEANEIRIEYRSDSPEQSGGDSGPIMRFGWNPPTGTIEPMMQEAVDLASNADVAVVVTRTYESEGDFDRKDLELPNNQDRLIQAVAAVNPNVVVVQMSGRAVQMNRWINEVPAVIQAWFAGQEQGNAIANVLFGDVNPSGHLPMTFPVDENSTPVSNEAQFPGVDGNAYYTEGVFVGYRGYQQFDIEPQFPFGHGLSYTTFRYSDLLTTATRSSCGQKFKVQLCLCNSGDRTGAEVVQVYAGRLPTNDVETPPKQLAGFAKVKLKPGKRKRVTIELDQKAFSYWDEETDSWIMPTGEVPIYVGASSEDIRLMGSIIVGE